MTNAAEVPAGEPVVMDAMTNGFSVVDDWVQISPYGDFPHSKGLQRVDKAAAQIMVNDFNSLGAKLANAFRGLPFYIGHPDGPPDVAKNWPDKSAYGWIKELAARDDGFYGKVQFNASGLDIIANKKFMYLSPAWYPKPVRDGGRTIMQPSILKSVGFVNDPNIPVQPLANNREVDFKDSMASLHIDEAVTLGTLTEADRAEWLNHFEKDYQAARRILCNYGTSEGARKGWETRRAGMGAASAKVTAKKLASGKMKNGRKLVKGSPYEQGGFKDPKYAGHFAAHAEGKLEKDASGNTIWHKDPSGGVQSSGAFAIRNQGGRGGYAVEKNGERLGASFKKEGAYAMAEKAHADPVSPAPKATPPPLPASARVAAKAYAQTAKSGLLSKIKEVFAPRSTSHNED